MLSGVEATVNPSHHADLVHARIIKCLETYMSQEEVIQTLLDQPGMDRDVIKLVWQRLEEQNEEFFRAYHLMRMVKEQISEFNRLLEKQATLINHLQHGVSVALMSNLSHMPPMHQSAECYTPETFGPASKTMQNHVTRTNLHGPFTNYGSSSIPMGMQNTGNMPVHSGRINAAPNIPVLHNSNVGMVAGTNGGMMNMEACYGSRLMHGPGNSVLETRAANGDAFVSTFRNEESNSQLMNDTLFSFGDDSDFSHPDLTADFVNSELESYPLGENLRKSPGHGRGGRTTEHYG